MCYSSQQILVRNIFFILKKISEISYILLRLMKLKQACAVSGLRTPSAG